jgi:hypothetical protein
VPQYRERPFFHRGDRLGCGVALPRHAKPQVRAHGVNGHTGTQFRTRDVQFDHHDRSVEHWFYDDDHESK